MTFDVRLLTLRPFALHRITVPHAAKFLNNCGFLKLTDCKMWLISYKRVLPSKNLIQCINLFIHTHCRYLQSVEGPRHSYYGEWKEQNTLHVHCEVNRRTDQKQSQKDSERCVN
jgi:hypothetical protein